VRGQIVETGIGLEAEARAAEAAKRLIPRGSCLECEAPVEWFRSEERYSKYCSYECELIAREGEEG